MSPDASEQPALLKLLQRASLPTGFERWRIEIAVGGQRPTDAAEWAGVFVLVETGQLEVECLAGGSRAFGEGDLLVLGWLPLRRLRNVGRTSVRLLCVRRAVEWLSPLEDRDGSLWATAIDPDGNYVQLIQLSDEHRRAMALPTGSD